MFPNHFREDYLRSLEDERDRIVRRNRLHLERQASDAIARNVNAASQAAVAGRRAGPWDGRERRHANPCPEMKEAATA